MTDIEIISILRGALGHLSPEVLSALSMQSTLTDLGIDSIQALELAGRMEKQLAIQLPDDELAQVNSIADLVQLIRRSTADQVGAAR